MLAYIPCMDPMGRDTCPICGISFQNDASYMWCQHLRAFVLTADRCWFPQSRMDVAKTAAFAADVFNDLLEVRAGRGWYGSLFQFLENAWRWQFFTSVLVLSHDEKSAILVANLGHLGMTFSGRCCLARVEGVAKTEQLRLFKNDKASMHINQRKQRKPQRGPLNQSPLPSLSSLPLNEICS